MFKNIILPLLLVSALPTHSPRAASIREIAGAMGIIVPLLGHGIICLTEARPSETIIAAQKTGCTVWQSDHHGLLIRKGKEEGKAAP